MYLAASTVDDGAAFCMECGTPIKAVEYDEAKVAEAAEAESFDYTTIVRFFVPLHSSAL